MKLAIDKLHEYIAAQAEVNSAAEGKEVADVNLKEKIGKLTGVQAIEARGAIKEKYRKQGDELKTKGENEALALKEAELKHSQEQEPGLEYDAGTKRRAADELKARLAASKANLPGAQKSLEEADKEAGLKAEAAGKKEDELRSLRGSARFGLVSGGALREAGGALTKAQQEAETAKQARDRQRRIVDEYKTDASEIPQKLLPQAEGAAKIAEMKATQNVQRITSLEPEIGELKETLPIRQAGRQAAGGLKDQTTQLDMAAQIEERKQSVLEKISDSEKHKTKLDAGTLNQLKDFATPMTGLGPGGSMSRGDANQLSAARSRVATDKTAVDADQQNVINYLAASKKMDSATMRKIEADTKKLEDDTRALQALENRVRSLEGSRKMNPPGT